MTTATEVHKMDHSKALKILESFNANSEQIPDEVVGALRLLMETGAVGESATRVVFTTLMASGKRLTGPQRATLLNNTGRKGANTLYNYAVMGEIICHEKVTIKRTDEWETLRTAVNKADKAGVSGEILDTLTKVIEKEGKISFSGAISLVNGLVPKPVREEMSPETATGGYIKSVVNYLTKVGDFKAAGGVLTEEHEAGLARAEAQLKAIRGK